MYVRTFHPSVVIASIPNGAAVSRMQRLRLVSEGLLPGFPDLIVCEPVPPYHGLFIEMKRDTDAAVVSPAQAKLHVKLRLKGYRVAVAYGYAAAKQIIADYLTEGVCHGN
jgi:hypothetical protein